MRFLILPYAAWMGLLSLATPLELAGDLPRIVATAGVLATLTVLIYRLGVWRQEMENTRNNVAAEVRSHLEQSAVNLARIEHQLDMLDHIIARYFHWSVWWQRRVTRRIDQLEARLT